MVANAMGENLVKSEIKRKNTYCAKFKPFLVLFEVLFRSCFGSILYCFGLCRTYPLLAWLRSESVTTF